MPGLCLQLVSYFQICLQQQSTSWRTEQTLSYQLQIPRWRWLTGSWGFWEINGAWQRWMYSTLNDYFGFHLPAHLLVGLLCHCKYVRIHVSHVLAWVGVNDCISIDMKLLVWIYSHQYNTWKWGNSKGWAQSIKPAPECSHVVWQSKLCFNSTAVCIDDSGLHESHFEIVQDRRFMQVAQSSEVIFPHQDVWVAKRGQFWPWRVNGVVALLPSNRWCQRVSL